MRPFVFCDIMFYMKNTLVLISGMDFSGKTTTVKEIKALEPDVVIRYRYLSDIAGNAARQEIVSIRESGNDVEKQRYRALARQSIEYDMKNYKPLNALVIQDTLFLLKHYSKRVLENTDHELIKWLEEQISLLPKMKSVFLTVGEEERKRRLDKRISDGERLAKTDKLLIEEPKKFFEIGDLYFKVVLKHFPDTKVIDTTQLTPKQVAQEVLDFLR